MLFPGTTGIWAATVNGVLIVGAVLVVGCTAKWLNTVVEGGDGVGDTGGGVSGDGDEVLIVTVVTDGVVLSAGVVVDVVEGGIVVGSNPTAARTSTDDICIVT